MSSDIVERLRQAHQTVPIPAIASLYSDAADEIKRLQGIQRAVVALARTVLGKSEHPVERSPWIDVIHMMDDEARRER